MHPIVQHHHDGHGLNDSIVVECDPRDPDAGNASHDYTATMDGGARKLELQFQHGPRDETGSMEGITGAVLIAIVLDRYEGFQAGPYACRENAIVITKLQETLHWMKHRADDRARRGVLGKNAS